MKMTPSQMRGMIDFHRRAEIAYRAAGKTQQADAAKAQREKLERKQAKQQNTPKE